jgi:hypothetical protein
LQLAVAALEDDGPLPGADAEYRKAREAQAALDRHENGTVVRRPASAEPVNFIMILMPLVVEAVGTVLA